MRASSLIPNHQSPIPALRGRIALITGASRGIGAAVAKRFAVEGAHVIITARDAKALESTYDAITKAGGNATMVALDLREPTKIEELSHAIVQRFGKLDILVGNAGVLGELSPLQDTAAEHWQQVMQVNLDANFHLIRCFDPLLKASDAPRAMFVTSGVTRRAAAYWGAYAVSKAALESMVKIYAVENSKSKLKANIIDPGVVRTRMRAAAYPGEDPMTLPEPDKITDVFVKLARADFKETGMSFDAEI